jgi:hypothetical protein
LDFITTDIVGYIASFAVLVAFLMKDIRTLRIINSIGCAFFVLYGVLLDNSKPIIITNSMIFLINMYYLFKGKNKD